MVSLLHVLLFIPALNLDVTDGFWYRSFEREIGGDQGSAVSKQGSITC